MLTQAATPFFAIIAAALGVTCLYVAWRQLLAAKVPLVWLGWTLLLISSWLWVANSGSEMGVAHALLSIPLLAWIAVLANRKIQFKKQRQQHSIKQVWPTTHGLVKNGLLFILVIPLAGAVSLLASVVLPRLFPWDEIDQLVMPVFLLPVIWGVAIYWLCAADKLWRPTSALIIAGAASALYLYW